MEYKTEFNKLYEYIMKKGVHNFINNKNDLIHLNLKNITEEDIILCQYVIAIDVKDLWSVNELNKKYIKESCISKNNISNNDIIYHIYKKGLLNKQRIRNIIDIENNIYFNISSAFITTLMTKKDIKLLTIIFKNFIYNDNYIKTLLYCYKNKTLLSNSNLEKLTFKERNKIVLCSKFNDISLIYACIYNIEEMVIYLVENGANVNTSNAKGYTPLIYACIHKNGKMVKYLIENDSSVNKEDGYGRTPLLHASINNDNVLMKYLINNGADINKKDNKDNLPLINAYLYRNKEMITYLIENGADPNIKNKNGETLLIDASKKNNNEMVSFLIENGVNVNEKSIHGDTPLNFALKNKNINMVKILINNGANITINNSIDHLSFSNSQNKNIITYSFDNKENRTENQYKKQKKNKYIIKKKVIIYK